MADRPSLPPAEQGLTADNTLMTEVTGFYRKFVALSSPVGRVTVSLLDFYQIVTPGVGLFIGGTDRYTPETPFPGPDRIRAVS